VILTEATTQSLRQLLKDPIGEMNVDSTMRRWLAKGLHTVTFEMQRDYAHACAAVEARPGFLTRYGHRGPGEMDLASPRWSEMGDLSFQKSSTEKIWENHSAEVETEILNINSYKKEMILEEWKFLKALLETREAWKMELLKPYAWIRLLVVELGRRSDLGNLIHWLSLEEILSGQDMSNRGESRKILDLISERKAEATEFRKFSLPDYLDLQILENILNQSPVAPARQADGEPLSPGLAFGEVRFVHDPAQVNPEDWPKDVILLAESTDPGWTPLFTRVRGVVVERGGVLSHCAILSREMGLPAVSGIQGLAQKFKDGDHVWVDGNHGRVTRDEN
jgi:phosphohistidine swiveling domain-containing protein